MRNRLFRAARPRARRTVASSACAYTSKNRETAPTGRTTHAAARSHAGSSKAHGFTKLWWTVGTLVSGAIATFFLSLALLTFDVGVGYAIWTSVAGVGIVIFGVLFLSQRLNWKKGLGIAVVIGGVVGLQLSGAA